MSRLQNFLNPNEFRFTMSRLPHVEFFVQGTLPNDGKVIDDLRPLG